MADQRVEKMARVLVDYSVAIQPGDKVMIEATTMAEPLVRAVYERVLQCGGHPHILFTLPDQDEIFYKNAKDAQLDFSPVFHKLAAEQFGARIRIYSEANTRALSHVDPAKMTRRQKTLFEIQQTILNRAGEGKLRWISTQFPTTAYAMEANMGIQEYADFLFSACHVDDGTPDPIAYWKEIEKNQRKYVDYMNGHDKVELHGPNVDLKLSIKGRTFLNSCGKHNLPDGEIYTGPVEDSAEGWVKYTYPAIYAGRAVEGVELQFREGRVVDARSQSGQDVLLQMIDSDPRARYLGEFAIGTNFQIDKFTHNILFDEKIGGTFHLALGSGYPETGSKNVSKIHWDMICDMRKDAEIRVDGELIYKNGSFVI